MGCNYSALWQMQQAQKEGENGAEGEDVKQVTEGDPQGETATEAPEALDSNFRSGGEATTSGAQGLHILGGGFIDGARIAAVREKVSSRPKEGWGGGFFDASQIHDSRLLREAEMGDAEGMLAEVDDGADINCRDWAGRTPLHIVAKQGRLDLARLLIELGADVKAKCKGLPVVRGAAWDKDVDGDSDGGAGSIGFAVAQGNGWCEVTWASGGTYLYRISPKPGKYTLACSESDTKEPATEKLLPMDLTPLGIVEQLRRSGGAPPPAAGGW